MFDLYEVATDELEGVLDSFPEELDAGLNGFVRQPKGSKTKVRWLERGRPTSVSGRRKGRKIRQTV